MSEIHGEKIAASFPWTLFGSWYLTVPLKHVDTAIIVLIGFGDEAERMITPPLFSFLLQAVDNKFVNLLLLHQNII